MNFLFFEKIDSTNAEALRRLAASSDVRALDKTVIASGEQSAGRGRMKRSFYSPAQSGIYFTAIYAPAKKIDDPALLTACAAVAVCRSLKKIFEVDAKIKWVNDIYVRQKKVCGILAEGHLSKDGSIDAAAIGIGINIFPSAFPAEINGRAGSVLSEAEFHAQDSGGADFRACKNSASDQGADGIREGLAKDVCQKLFDILEDTEKSRAALEEYAVRSFIVGKRVAVVPVIGDQKSVYDATVLGIDGGARLLVRLDDGSRRALSSGEISIKI